MTEYDIVFEKMYIFSMSITILAKAFPIDFYSSVTTSYVLALIYPCFVTMKSSPIGISTFTIDTSNTITYIFVLKLIEFVIINLLFCYEEIPKSNKTKQKWEKGNHSTPISNTKSGTHGSVARGQAPLFATSERSMVIRNSCKEQMLHN